MGIDLRRKDLGGLLRRQQLLPSLPRHCRQTEMGYTLFYSLLLEAEQV